MVDMPELYKQLPAVRDVSHGGLLQVTYGRISCMT
jgi:hypothetical protein